jgi:hypothetical protein
MRGKVVIDGFVLRAAVIPYSDAVRLPVETAAEFGGDYMFK